VRTPLSSKLLITPGAQQFLQELLQDLGQRRNVIVLVPLGVDTSVLSHALRSELWRRDFHFSELNLSTLPDDKSPWATLSGLVKPKCADSRRLPSLGREEEVDDGADVLFLECFERLASHARSDWLSALVRWSDLSRRLRDAGKAPTALFLLCSATSLTAGVPDERLELAIKWWCGIPSALELQLLCRIQRADTQGQPADAWREQVLPALAGNDMEAADLIWDDILVDQAKVEKKLRALAESREWSKEKLQRLGAEEFLTVGMGRPDPELQLPPLSQQWRKLWAINALCWTPEYGIELNSAGIVVLEQFHELNHRMWRGQAPLLLPFLDNIRISFCRFMTDRYGRGWPTRYSSPLSPEETKAAKADPFSCQFGYIETLLRNCTELTAERHWLPIVGMARWIRNELAHYRPVEFRNFESIWQESLRFKSHTVAIG